MVTLLLAERVVLLDPLDLAWADEIGLRRASLAVSRHKMDRLGSGGPDTFRSHRVGARGEMALCRFFGATWAATVNSFKRPDVWVRGRAFEVRTATVRPGYPRRVKIGTNDPDARLVAAVFTDADALRFEIAGWCRAGAAKLPQYLRNPGCWRPAYFYPANELQWFDRLG